MMEKIREDRPSVFVLNREAVASRAAFANVKATVQKHPPDLTSCGFQLQ